MKTLACKDIDPSLNCHFVAKGNSDKEVISQMMKHAQEAHPEKMEEMEKMPKEETEKMMMEKIKTE